MYFIFYIYVGESVDTDFFYVIIRTLEDIWGVTMKNCVIFFDLFDTLIKVNRGYLEEYFDKELDKLGDIGAIKDSVSTINEIVKKHPEVLDKHSVEDMTFYYEKVMRDSLMNVDLDVLNMLKKLKEKGYKLCIISDATFVDIMHFDESPLAKYFDNKVFSCEYGVAKPDSKIYQIALDVMANPSKTIFVGDGGHDELIGAKTNGMITIKVEWFKRNLNYDSVDYLCNVMDHLVRIIDKLDVNN